MATLKKCNPLNCKTFARRAEKLETKMPVDVLVVKCPYRTQKCECTNEKESLTERFY